MNKEITFSNNGIERTFVFDDEDSEKYIMFSCAKNEDPYIREWVTHNINIGFDKIIIADNNDDSTRLPVILSDFISKGEVQILDCSGMDKIQLQIYNLFLEKSNYKWCAYFDCDEFLELSQDTSVKQFLERIKEDCVLINWVVFGGCGNFLYKEGNLKDRFTEPVYPAYMLKENFYVKPIVRGGKQFIWFDNTHCPLPKYIYSYSLGGYEHVNYKSHVYAPARYKYAYIRHYYTKSFEEWITNKIKRGWPDEMPREILSAENYFLLNNDTEYPLKKYIKGIFVDNTDFKERKEDKEEIMAKNKVICLYSSSKNVYGLILEAFFLMTNFTDHVFVFKDKFVDDYLYGLFFEYALITGNTTAFSFNDDDFKNILEKYTDNLSFYWLNCL